MKRVCFVGKSGIGKSTLINMLCNNTTDVVDSPAKTANSTSCVTRELTSYAIKDLWLIDSVALDANRCTNYEILAGLRQLIWQATAGLHVFAFCVGSLDETVRNDIKMLQLLLGDRFKEILVVVMGTTTTFDKWVETLDAETRVLAGVKKVLFVENSRQQFLTDFVEEAKKVERMIFPLKTIDFDKLVAMYLPSLSPEERSRAVPSFTDEHTNWCALCMCQVLSSDCQTSSCQHSFHLRCLSVWGSQICPVCEEEMQ